MTAMMVSLNTTVSDHRRRGSIKRQNYLNDIPHAAAVIGDPGTVQDSQQVGEHGGGHAAGTGFSILGALVGII